MSGFVLTIYIILLVFAVIAWSKTKTLPFPNLSAESVSIIVPFRNEAKNLAKLLLALQRQAYDSPFEIILINDHSSDEFQQELTPFLEQIPHLKLLSLDVTEGKKAAIAKGISEAKFDLILQTDADCVPSQKWISTMTAQLAGDTAMVCGPTEIESDGKWSWFNQIETIMLQVITAAGIYWDFPVMANGANLLYHKKDYLKYQLSNHGQTYQSGDDQFLMEFLSQQGKSIKYCKSRWAIVTTKFSNNWDEMIAQRARWAGKNKRNNGFKTVFNFFIALTQVYFLVLLLGVFYDQRYFWISLNFLLVKSLIEGLVVAFAASFFSFKQLNKIPLFAIYYPFFFLQIAIKVIHGNNNWKQRSIN